MSSDGFCTTTPYEAYELPMLSGGSCVKPLPVMVTSCFAGSVVGVVTIGVSLLTTLVWVLPDAWRAFSLVSSPPLATATITTMAMTASASAIHTRLPRRGARVEGSSVSSDPWVGSGGGGGKGGSLRATIGAPHSPQNFWPSGLSCPLVHCMTANVRTAWDTIPR